MGIQKNNISSEDISQDRSAYFNLMLSLAARNYAVREFNQKKSVPAILNKLNIRKELKYTAKKIHINKKVVI